MKKMMVLIICVAMLVSMAISANAATAYLPDGGQTGNCGCSRAYGRTKNYTVRAATMDCRAALTSTASGTITASIYSSENVGNSLYLGIVAWQDAAQNYNLSSTYGRKQNVGKSGSWSFSGGSATHHGTAGFTYNSTEYGDWVCGVTTAG